MLIDLLDLLFSMQKDVSRRTDMTLNRETWHGVGRRTKFRKIAVN